MKKTFTLLAAVLLLAGTAAARTMQAHELPLLDTNPAEFGEIVPFAQPDNHITMAKAAAESSESASSVTYSPAGDIYGYSTLDNQVKGLQIAQAIQLNTAVANKFSGNKITEVSFYTGCNTALSSGYNYVNSIRTATVFLCYDLENFEPFYTQEVDLPVTGATLVNVTLDTPYEFEQGKAVYAGFYCTLTSANDAVLIFDYLNHGQDVSGSWAGTRQPASEGNENPDWVFRNYASYCGFFCIGVTIAGDKLPVNEMSVGTVVTTPRAIQNVNFAAQAIVYNNASNPISTIDVDVQVGDLDAETLTFDFSDDPITYNRGAYLYFEELSYPTPSKEGVPVAVTVTKVNGNENKAQTKSARTTLQILPEDSWFATNVVVEEFTGTWCQYCPQGYVSMEALRELYTDGSVIPVAVHDRDAMSNSSYHAICDLWSNGTFPSAVINRTEFTQYLYPTENLTETIEAYKAIPAAAQVTGTAKLSDDKTSIIFDVETQFSFDSETASTEYALCFGITEDNVGPYAQKNYFTSQPAGTLPGFDNGAGATVSLIFNDVARQYDAARVKNSIPETVEAGKKYSFQYEMKFLAKTVIDDYDRVNGIVYLINLNDKSIENACQIISEYRAGVEDITVPDNSNAPVEYFNLQGIRVANPDNGIFIRRQGNSATKVIL